MKMVILDIFKNFSVAFSGGCAMIGAGEDVYEKAVADSVAVSVSDGMRAV